MESRDIKLYDAHLHIIDQDFDLLVEALGFEGASKVLCENAVRFYRPAEIG